APGGAAAAPRRPGGAGAAGSGHAAGADEHLTALAPVVDRLDRAERPPQRRSGREHDLPASLVRGDEGAHPAPVPPEAEVPQDRPDPGLLPEEPEGAGADVLEPGPAHRGGQRGRLVVPDVLERAQADPAVPVPEPVDAGE